MQDYTNPRRLNVEEDPKREKWTRTALRRSLYVLVFTAIATGPASAIQCEGEYQVLGDNQLHWTPYCADEQLAERARLAGVPIDGDTVRYEPGTKDRLCSLISIGGYDPSTDCPDRNP